MTSAGEGRKETVGGVCAGTTDSAWGVIATNVPEAKTCIGRCQKQFFERLLPTYDWASFNWTLFSDNAETIPLEACEALSEAKGRKDSSPLWELYCCDSLLCGVRTGESLRQDPNVNSAMLHCQSRGIPPLHDPGPPPEGYECPANSVARDDDGLPCQRSNAKFVDILPGSTTEVSSITAITTEPRPMPSMTTTSTSTLASGAVVLTRPGKESAAREEPGGLSAGSRAAVAVCSVLALIAILAAILCCLRRRRHRRHRGYPPALRYVGPVKPAGSPTPLISPTSSGTSQPRSSLPPLRLRDRKLLPNILGSDRMSSDHSPSIPGSPPAPPPTYSGFPESPLRSPATNKLVPRFEQVPRIHGPSSGAKIVKTASLSSSGSNRTTTASAHSTSPSSPSRPPRPHETPLEIPDLVRPSTSRGQTPRPGPPPNRALPPAPRLSPSSTSAGWPSAPPSHVHGDVGVAVGLVSHNPAQGVTLQPESQDLCELTERYGRESRDSWGSWGGTGGGGPGVVASTPQKKGAGVLGSPVLEEADLERMGGRY